MFSCTALYYGPFHFKQSCSFLPSGVQWKLTFQKWGAILGAPSELRALGTCPSRGQRIQTPAHWSGEKIVYVQTICRKTCKLIITRLSFTNFSPIDQINCVYSGGANSFVRDPGPRGYFCDREGVHDCGPPQWTYWTTGEDRTWEFSLQRSWVREKHRLARRLRNNPC